MLHIKKMSVNKLLKYPILSRNFLTRPSTAIDILNSAKKKKIEIHNKDLYVNKDDDCYKCYDIMKKNFLSYLPVKNEKGITIGLITQYDVKCAVLFHEYEEEEDEKIREDMKALPH